jgi:hypothetical protein
VAFVDEDHSEASRMRRDALHQLFVKPAAELSIEEIDPAMDSGRFTFVVNIRPNFEGDLMRGRSTPIQLNVDAAATSQVTNQAHGPFWRRWPRRGRSADRESGALAPARADPGDHCRPLRLFLLLKE